MQRLFQMAHSSVIWKRSESADVTRNKKTKPNSKRLQIDESLFHHWHNSKIYSETLVVVLKQVTKKISICKSVSLLSDPLKTRTMTFVCCQIAVNAIIYDVISILHVATITKSKLLQFFTYGNTKKIANVWLSQF